MGSTVYPFYSETETFCDGGSLACCISQKRTLSALPAKWTCSSTSVRVLRYVQFAGYHCVDDPVFKMFSNSDRDAVPGRG